MADPGFPLGGGANHPEGAGHQQTIFAKISLRSANDREMYLRREELNQRETTQRVLQIYGTRDIVSTGLLTLGHLM